MPRQDGVEGSWIFFKRLCLTYRCFASLELTTTPIVHVKNGEVFANSRDVADFFEKRHDHVIRDINNLLMGLPKSGDTPFNWFKPAPYVAQNGETYGSYDMTKDGFTLLVMGYTGAKAIQFKLVGISKSSDTPQHPRGDHRREPLVCGEGRAGSHRRFPGIPEWVPCPVHQLPSVPR